MQMNSDILKETTIFTSLLAQLKFSEKRFSELTKVINEDEDYSLEFQKQCKLVIED